MKQLTFIEALDMYLDLREQLFELKLKGKPYTTSVDYVGKARQLMLKLYTEEKQNLLKQAGVIIK